MTGERFSEFPPDSFDPEDFQCLRCGKCCRWKGLVKITEAEADAIAVFLKMEPRMFIENLTRLSPDRSTLSLLEKEDGSCFFYDEELRCCRIQSVKPEQCRAFPFAWNFPGWEDVCEGGIRMKGNRRKTGGDAARRQ